jgi:DNA-binding CsgD family transcriptional regulator
VGTPATNGAGTGFVLLDCSLSPLYFNACAAEILLYPDKPRHTKKFHDQLATTVRMMISNGGPDGTISVCPEFVSGERRYICRMFNLQSPDNGTNGTSTALLLERRPPVVLHIRKICRRHNLTQREGQAVEWLVHGLTNKGIAARMSISPNTVKVFLRLAMMKMGVTSRSGMMSKFINGSTDFL